MAILMWKGTVGPHYMEGPMGQYPDGVPHSVTYAKGENVGDVAQARFRVPRVGGGLNEFYWSPQFFYIISVDNTTSPVETFAQFQVEVFNDELKVMFVGAPTTDPENPGQLYVDPATGNLKVSL